MTLLTWIGSLQHSLKFLLAFFKILPRAINHLAAAAAAAACVQPHLKEIYRLCAVRETASDAPLSAPLSYVTA